MAETTGISWADATVNFWHGCKKVSEGCKYCYMFRDKARWHKDGSDILKTQPSTVNGILTKLKIQAEERARLGLTNRIRIFTCSLSDFFIEEADHWRKEAWDIIRSHPQFDWLILTKRPERVIDALPVDWGQGWSHVWLGVSAENQARWNERVPVLLNLPASIRFVSAEPLLGPIEIEEPFPFGFPGLDWLILGGESGNENGPWKFRPAAMSWFHSLIEQAKFFHVAVFMKQTGTHIAKLAKAKDRAGADPEEWEPFFRVQQFPK